MGDVKEPKGAAPARPPKLRSTARCQPTRGRYDGLLELAGTFTIGTPMDVSGDKYPHLADAYQDKHDAGT